MPSVGPLFGQGGGSAGRRSDLRTSGARRGEKLFASEEKRLGRHAIAQLAEDVSPAAKKEALMSAMLDAAVSSSARAELEQVRKTLEGISTPTKVGRDLISSGHVLVQG